MIAARHAVEVRPQPFPERRQQCGVGKVGPAFILTAQEGDPLAQGPQLRSPGQGRQSELPHALQHGCLESLGIRPGERLVLEDQRAQPPALARQHRALARAPLDHLLGDDALGVKFLDLARCDRRGEEDARVLR